MKSIPTKAQLRVLTVLLSLLVAFVHLPSGFADQGYQIGDSAIAQGVSTDVKTPINRTQTFLVTDYGAYSWINLVNIQSPSHVVKWVWQTPQGHVYYKYNDTIPDPGVGRYWSGYYLYTYTQIGGHDVGHIPGNWTVLIYIDGSLALTQSFTIVDNSPVDQPTEGFAWPTYDVQVSVQQTPSHAYQDVVDAMKQWNYSQAWFASRYGLAARPTFHLSISNTASAQIQVVFNKTQTIGTTEPWGYASYDYWYSASRVFTKVNCSVSIVLAESDGTLLNDVALENVALHELGHCLGLTHPPMAGDTMNASSGTFFDLKYPSTMNLYALYQLSAVRTYGGVPETYTLPSGIPYVESPAFNGTASTTSSSATTTTTSSSSQLATTSTSSVPEFPNAALVLLVTVSVMAVSAVVTRKGRGGPSQKS